MAGQLKLRGLISGEQYEAVERYGATIKLHAAIMGYSISPVRSACLERVIGTTGADAGDVDPAVAERIKLRFRDCYRVLMDAVARVGMAVCDLAIERMGMQEAEQLLDEIHRGLDALGAMRHRRARTAQIVWAI